MIPLIFALVGAVMNRVRGGWPESEDLPNDFLNALAFAGLCYLFSHDAFLCLMLGGAMYLGAAPGWGVYFGAMNGTLPAGKELKEFWLVDFIIRPLRGNPRLWGTVSTFLRGAFWALCLTIPFALLAGTANSILWQFILVAGILMPPCYILPYKWLGTAKWKGFGWWEWGEVAYGFCLWGAFAWYYMW